MPRPDGRQNDELRPLTITRGFTDAAAGSVLIEMGRTRVLCTASVEVKIPDWLRGKGRGWVTAEYSMLPGSTAPRKRREYGKRDGRSVEISRLIGRSLRAAVDLTRLPETSIWLDCDVLVADGGTRTASITGAWVALRDACTRLMEEGRLESDPITSAVAAASVGIVGGTPVLDLPYVEDANADVDMNVVMTSAGELVEVQGSAEKGTFTLDEHETLIRLAASGIRRLNEAQTAALEGPLPEVVS